MATPLTLDTTAAAVHLDNANERSNCSNHAMSTAFDIELSPTESEGGHNTNNHNNEETTISPLHQSANSKPTFLSAARPYDMIMSSVDDDATTKPTGGGLLSQRILQAVQHHQLQRALQENRRARCNVRRAFALVVSILPIVLFAWSLMVAEERDDDNGKTCHFSLPCLLGQVEEETYFGFVAVCGGFGALLYSDEFWNYSLARWVGGCVSALGSILTIWTVSQSISSVEDHSAVVLALMCIFLGVLGSLPGLLFYHVIKIAIDECFAAESDDLDDEYAALTVNLQAEASQQ